MMQSDGNTFCGYVVFDSFNMEYRGKDNISDQDCAKQKYWIFIKMIYNLRVMEENAHEKKYSTLFI